MPFIRLNRGPLATSHPDEATQITTLLFAGYTRIKMLFNQSHTHTHTSSATAVHACVFILFNVLLCLFFIIQVS